MLGPELIQISNEPIQKIRVRMQTTQSKQKSYADIRHKDLEFEVGDNIFLKVAPMKGVLRFGSFEILERNGPVAYRLSLPPSLDAVHNVFHVSMLRKYVATPSHIVDYKPLQLWVDLSYEEETI